jgi:ABC-type glycerol-3-phosphate transport system permease component
LVGNRGGNYFSVHWLRLTKFVLALVTIDRNDPKPLALVPLYSGQFRPGVMFAILAPIAIFVLAIYILMQRYLTRGMLCNRINSHFLILAMAVLE